MASFLCFVFFHCTSAEAEVYNPALGGKWTSLVSWQTFYTWWKEVTTDAETKFFVFIGCICATPGTEAEVYDVLLSGKCTTLVCYQTFGTWWGKFRTCGVTDMLVSGHLQSDSHFCMAREESKFFVTVLDEDRETLSGDFLYCKNSFLTFLCFALAIIDDSDKQTWSKGFSVLVEVCFLQQADTPWWRAVVIGMIILVFRAVKLKEM